ncbi:unnamed protein product [Urochloa humidicola]
MSVLERWFTQLGVGWVLHLADGASVEELKHSGTFDTWHWIQALTEIIEAIRLTTFCFPSDDFVGVPGICQEEPETQSGKQASSTDQFQFAQFFQQAMLKMLVFVDLIVAMDPNITCKRIIGNRVLLKIDILLHVRGALVDALSQIPLPSHPPSAEVGRIQDENHGTK